MTKQEKTNMVDGLKEKFSSNSFFYLTDSSTLTVAEINQFRRLCFNSGIEMKVVKNTLAIKALESLDNSENYEPLYDLLKGPTAILFAQVANAPGKILEEFRKKNERPILKGAYIDTAVFIGDDKIKDLASLKSKEDLIGEIVALLQSPAKNVISSLKSGGSTIAGLLKTLEERASA
jgi:large subunit ribosomal protein L10